MVENDNKNTFTSSNMAEEDKKKLINNLKIYLDINDKIHEEEEKNSNIDIVNIIFIIIIIILIILLGADYLNSLSFSKKLDNMVN